MADWLALATDDPEVVLFVRDGVGSPALHSAVSACSEVTFEKSAVLGGEDAAVE